jgi:hypothetical protein
MSRKAAAVLVSAFSMLPCVGRAQDTPRVPPGFDAVAHQLKAGDTVVVTDAGGKVIRGNVKQASETLLVIRVKDQDRSMDPSDVIRISRPSHSIRKGALIGLAAGFTFGAVAAANSGCGYVCFSKPIGVLAIGGFFGGIGMGVGALTGVSLRREHVIFERAGTTHAHKSQLCPRPQRA